MYQRNIGCAFESLISSDENTSQFSRSGSNESLPVIDFGNIWSFTYFMRSKAPATPSSDAAQSSVGSGFGSNYENAIHLIGEVSNVPRLYIMDIVLNLSDLRHMSFGPSIIT